MTPTPTPPPAAAGDAPATKAAFASAAKAGRAAIVAWALSPVAFVLYFLLDRLPLSPHMRRELHYYERTYSLNPGLFLNVTFALFLFWHWRFQSAVVAHR